MSSEIDGFQYLERLQAYMESFYDSCCLEDEDVREHIECRLDPIVGLLLELLADKIGISPSDLIAHVFVDDFGQNRCKYHNSSGEVVLIKDNQDFIDFWKQNKA